MTWPKYEEEHEKLKANTAGKKLTLTGMEMSFVNAPPPKDASDYRFLRGLEIDGEYACRLKLSKIRDAVCCLKGPSITELGATTRITFPATEDEQRIGVVHTMGKHKTLQLRVILTSVT